MDLPPVKSKFGYGPENIGFSVPLLISTVIAYCHGDVVNEFDKRLNFTCSSHSQAIHAISSIHRDYNEDRQFDMTCTYVTNGTSGTPSCVWSDFTNEMDTAQFYSCPTNHYISGLFSDHDDVFEDRIWRVYCCEMQDVHMIDCSLSGWTNEMDKPQKFVAPDNKVIKGVNSYHDNHYEDRRYKYEYCTVAMYGGSTGQIVG